MTDQSSTSGEDARAEERGSSPYATGGGGVTFERRVAVTYLARLLAGGSPPEVGGGRVVHRVAFQQGPVHPVDDIVVTASLGDSAVVVSVAARRKPHFVRSDHDTQQLIGSLIRAVRRQVDDAEHRLVVAVAGHQTTSSQVQELADVARAHADAASFFTALEMPGRFRAELRARLAHVKALVSSALAETHVALDAVHATWLILSNLWVVSLRLESPDETDWGATADLLVAVSRGQCADGALSLLAELESLAATYAPTGATVDAPMLRRAVHRLLHQPAYRTSAAWQQVEHLWDVLAATTRREVGAAPDVPLHLERDAERAVLMSAVTSHPAGAVVVTGPSGAGKSSLVLDVLTDLAADRDNVEVVGMSLRHVPATSVELRAAVGADLRELLLVLSAPRRYLVVDAAEAALESRTEILAYLAAAARDAEVRLIAVTTDEGAALVSSVLADQRVDAEFHAVGLLTDGEVDQIGERFPRLAPLVDNPTSRDLIRRPVVADLLARAGASGEILSEAATMQAIWLGLVLNNGQQTRGHPVERERVVRELALDALFATGVNESALDASAIAGLRADGVLQAESSQPWTNRLAFAHDQLRTYAAAGVLGGSSALVADLQRAGVPRWALPATRIAAQLKIESSSDPARTMYQLQRAFNEIAIEHGGRWADVPAEALLASSQPGPVLKQLWPDLVSSGAGGLSRIIRLVDQRHRDRYALRADAFAPIVELLLDNGVPEGFDERVTELIDDWLRTLLQRQTPAGHGLRIRLRQQVIDNIEQGRTARERAELERQERLARRTPEEVEADRLRQEELRRFTSVITTTQRSHRRRRELPDEVTAGWTVRRLALLGPDAGTEGAALLRKVAEHDPHRIAPAVETPMAAWGIAQLDRSLLAAFVEAYYIEEEEDDGFGGGFMEDGIRDHDPRNWALHSPMAAYYRGPFLVLFRSDLIGGVRALNNLLNHAARHRERRFLARGRTPEDGHRHKLHIAGEERTYIGDEHVWQWHAGTGVGPYPCMSALQALEFVASEWLAYGVPLDRFIALLLDGCENVAMVGLVVRLLAQRLDSVGTLLDPFLREPDIWHFEFSRSAAEGHGLRVRAHDQLDETRAWNFRDISVRLCVAAGNDTERADALRALGGDLVMAAARLYQERGLDEPTLAEALAVVRGWATFLDTNRYEWQQVEGGYSLSVVPPDDVVDVLSSSNEVIARDRRTLHLPFRYTAKRDRTQRIETEIPIDELIDDLAFVRSFQRPPESRVDDASAAVAATVIAVYADTQGQLAETDVAWAVDTLVAAASEASNDWQYFGQGADRSAALALPRVLLLEKSPKDPDEIEHVLHRLATEGSVETRTYLAVGLSVVFRHPCTPGRCAHLRAHDVLVATSRRCALGAWNPETMERNERILPDPLSQALDSVPAEDLIPEYMAPPIRGLSEAAVGVSCVAEEARELGAALLFYQARAVISRDHPGQHSSSEALIAARAALTFVEHDGSFEPVAGVIWAYANDDHALGELLTALAAAAEERSGLATTLRSIWPRVVDLVLALIDAGNVPIGWGYLDARSLSDLVPYATAPDFHYLRRELDGDPIAWTDLLGWRDTIGRWVTHTGGRGECLDHLLWLAESTLSENDQVDVLMPWVETFIATNAELAVTRSRSLADWLRSMRTHVAGLPAEASWRRVADAVVLHGGASAADLAD